MTSSTDLVEDVDPAPLFEPFSLAGLELANRLVMAPMTRGSSPGGVPNDDNVAYYRRRASHIGLIVTEGTFVDHPSAGSSDRVPRFSGEDALEGWRRVVDAVHGEGGRIFPQLWHLGAARRAGSPPDPTAPVLSPSGIAADGQRIGEAATTRDIDDVVASFARASADARRLGFDGIELHGAHGYLIDQFLWPVTNRRDDAYGGDARGRSRLAAEIITAIRATVGRDFPIVFRFSQWKVGAYDARIAETPQELDALLAPLVDAGVSGFHVSTRRYWAPGFEESPRTLAGWTRSLTGLPVIALGSVGVASPFLGDPDTEPDAASLSIAPLLDLLAQGEFDLVALGRAVLSDPEWPVKIRTGTSHSIRLYDKEHERTLW